MNESTVTTGLSGTIDNLLIILPVALVVLLLILWIVWFIRYRKKQGKE